MIHGFRRKSGRTVCLLAVFGLLVVAVPGCDNASKKEEGAGASPVPTSVQESNKNMENMMKSQAGTKK